MSLKTPRCSKKFLQFGKYFVIISHLGAGLGLQQHGDTLEAVRGAGPSSGRRQACPQPRAPHGFPDFVSHFFLLAAGLDKAADGRS